MHAQPGLLDDLAGQARRGPTSPGSMTPPGGLQSTARCGDGWPRAAATGLFDQPAHHRPSATHPDSLPGSRRCPPRSQRVRTLPPRSRTIASPMSTGMSVAVVVEPESAAGASSPDRVGVRWRARAAGPRPRSADEDPGDGHDHPTPQLRRSGRHEVDSSEISRPSVDSTSRRCAATSGRARRRRSRAAGSVVPDVDPAQQVHEREVVGEHLVEASARAGRRVSGTSAGADGDDPLVEVDDQARAARRQLTGVDAVEGGHPLDQRLVERDRPASSWANQLSS